MDNIENSIRQFDESATALVRTMPNFLWNFYNSLVKEGFSSEQAMTLTTKYLEKITEPQRSG